MGLGVRVGVWKTKAGRDVQFTAKDIFAATLEVYGFGFEVLWLLRKATPVILHGVVSPDDFAFVACILGLACRGVGEWGQGFIFWGLGVRVWVWKTKAMRAVPSKANDVFAATLMVGPRACGFGVRLRVPYRADSLIRNCPTP